MTARFARPARALLGALLLALLAAAPAAAAPAFGPGVGTSLLTPGPPPLTLAVAFTAADLNADGAIDGVSGPAGGAAGVLTAVNGGLLAPTAISLPFAMSSFITGRLDGDGVDDILMTGSTSAKVELGNGTGGFRALPPSVPTFTGGTFPGAFADLDGDGHNDVLVASDAGPPAGNALVSYALGDGTGALGSPQVLTLPASSGPPAATPIRAIAAADFNGDHRLDVLAGSATGDALFIAMAKPSPSGPSDFFLAANRFNVGVTGVVALAAADLTGSGAAAAILAHTGSNGVSVIPISSAGLPGTAVTTALPCAPRAMAVADLDLDGDPDVAIQCDTTIEVLDNQGGTLSAPVDVTANGSGNGVGLHAGDVDHDGRPDLLAGFQSNVAVLRNITPATVSAPATVALGAAPAGGLGAPVTVTITQTSGAPAGIVTSVGGANAADVLITRDGCATARLLRGQSCSVDVRLAPGAVGTRSAVLAFGSLATVALTGTGTAGVDPSGAASLRLIGRPLGFPGGLLLVQAHVDRAGKLTAAATARVRAGGRTKTVTLATATATAGRGGGDYALVLRPTAAGRAALRRGKVAVVLSVTFKPASGRAPAAHTLKSALRR